MLTSVTWLLILPSVGAYNLPVVGINHDSLSCFLVEPLDGHACRQKLGASMLEACGDLVRGCNEELNQICLHVRIDNGGACSLYQEAGFKVESTDSLLKLFSGSREHLMCYAV